MGRGKSESRCKQPSLMKELKYWILLFTFLTRIYMSELNKSENSSPFLDFFLLGFCFDFLCPGGTPSSGSDANLRLGGFELSLTGSARRPVLDVVTSRSSSREMVTPRSITSGLLFSSNGVARGTAADEIVETSTASSSGRLGARSVTELFMLDSTPKSTKPRAAYWLSAVNCVKALNTTKISTFRKQKGRKTAACGGGVPYRKHDGIVVLRSPCTLAAMSSSKALSALDDFWCCDFIFFRPAFWALRKRRRRARAS